MPSQNETNKEPDYKKLFKEAIYHLRAMTGSRNSFTPQVNGLLYASKELPDGFALRTREVEEMQKDALRFCVSHETTESIPFTDDVDQEGCHGA